MGVESTIYIADGDGYGRLISPGKEEFEIITVMNMGAGVWALASQPLGEFLDFSVHLLPPDDRIELFYHQRQPSIMHSH